MTAILLRPAITGLLLLFLGWNEALGQTNSDLSLARPEQKNDGWETATLNDVGIEASPLDTLLRRLRDSTYTDIHSMLIVRNNKLVFERYFDGYAWDYQGDRFRGAWTRFDANTLDNMASATKSVTALATGIAIDQGHIKDADERVFAFFPEYDRHRDERKDRLEVHHLLTMTSGLQWNEQDVFYSDPANDIVQLFLVEDPVEYILSKPAMVDPDTQFYYNGGGTNLVGEIVRNSTGMPLDSFTRAHLFEPLGITRYEWEHINPEMVDASGGLKLRPRDMARLGSLLLSKGVWNGQRIVSSAWCEVLTQPYVRFNATDGYGHHWWTRTYTIGPSQVESARADGWGGQRIMIFPTLNMVVVFTGGNYVTEPPLDDIIQRYVLPAALQSPR